MNPTLQQPSHGAWPSRALAVMATAMWLPVLGATPPGSADARAVHERDLAVCHGNRSNQDRPTCLREAHAAYAEARRGNLVGDSAQTANALRRCEPLPEADRNDCIARMQGQGTTRGSVAEGGIYRELTTPELGAPAPGLPPSAR